MNRFFTLLLLLGITSMFSKMDAQCAYGNGLGVYGTAAASATSGCRVLASPACHYDIEDYAQFTALTVGGSYTISSTVATDYLTVYSTSNTTTPIGFGTSPVVITADNDIIQVVIATSAGTCTGASTATCRSIGISNNAFTVSAPTCPSMTSPANNAVNQGVNLTFNWTAPQAGSTYNFYLGVGCPASTYQAFNGRTTNSIGLTNLALNTTYSWYVEEVNCNGVVATGCSATPFCFTTTNGNTFSPTGASGSWSDVASWSGGQLPACGDVAIIAAGKTCIVDVTNATCGDMSILGILQIPGGGTLTTGQAAGTCAASAGGNAVFTIQNGGKLEVTGGNLNLNGRFQMIFSTVNPEFVHSGGTIRVDGNDGTAGGSIASGTTLFNVNNRGTLPTTSCVWSGGTIVFVDPPFGTSGNTITPSSITGNVSLLATGGHTVSFGDGVSSTSGGFYFSVASLSSAGRLSYSNLVINTGGTIASGNNRYVSTLATSATLPILGNLTIMSGSELQTNSSFFLRGSFTNNGIATIPNLSLVEYTGTTTSSVQAVATAQSISGSGVFRNLAVPTANISTFLINNTSGSPISIPSTMLSGIGTGSVATTLTLTAGKLNVGSTPLILGLSTTSLGTLSPAIPTAASYIIGEMQRWRGTATGNQFFPVGTATAPRFAQINFTTGQTTGGITAVKFSSSNPGTSGLPLAANAENNNIAVAEISPSGSWNIERLSGAGGTYTAIVDATGFTMIDGSPIPAGNFPNLALVKRSTSSPWSLGATGTASAVTGLATLTRTGMTTFSDFALGGAAGALPIELAAFNAKAMDKANKIEWVTLSEYNVAEFLIERSKDGRSNWMALGTEKPSNTGAGLRNSYYMMDAAPMAATYYRLRAIDYDGSESMSNVVLVERKDKGAIVSVFPNPTADYVNVRLNESEGGALTISDVTGKVLVQRIVAPSNNLQDLKIDVSTLDNGMYILQFGDQTQQIIKQ